MTAWTRTSDCSALLPVPPTLHYHPLDCCTDTHKKDAFSDFLSINFLVSYSSKDEGIMSPCSVGGFSFSISSSNLWLGQFIKATVVGGLRSFLSTHHVTQLGSFWERLPSSEPRRWGDSEDNVICSTCWKNSNKAPQRRTPAEGLCHLPPWILTRDQPMQRGGLLAVRFSRQLWIKFIVRQDWTSWKMFSGATVLRNATTFPPTKISALWKILLRTPLLNWGFRRTKND